MNNTFNGNPPNCTIIGDLMLPDDILHMFQRLLIDDPLKLKLMFSDDVEAGLILDRMIANAQAHERTQKALDDCLTMLKERLAELDKGKRETKSE